ncbi:MAG TPA: alpha-amylase family glycosyl hydrolase [Gemmataceae bacterium]|nr:alpha-amylase family glycosyl hydrolase [Gemmataceae bacterium]
MAQLCKWPVAALWLGLLLCLAPVTRSGPAKASEDEDLQKNNLVYEIFVRSFCDGDKAPKQKNRRPGNLRGLLSKLDTYLNDGDPKTTHDLEVGILWLMPIFPSPSYHGYDVTDYRAIHPDYGTMDDFKALLKEAHRRGVRIILDIPFNHTSDEHLWFKVALADKTSPLRAFYQIEPDEGPRPGGWHPATGGNGERLRYFGLFSSKMPDLNFANPKVKQEVKAIARFWLDLGVDGFRLDAAKHIFGDRFDQLREQEILQNNDWWLEFSQFVYKHKEGAVLVGEVLGDYEALRRHAWGLDGLLGEPFMNEVRSQVSGPRPGFLGRYKQFLRQARELNRSAFNPRLGFKDQPFQSFDYVASHDRNPRLASDLEEMKRRGMQPEVDQAYRLTLYMLLTMSSRPILYQGDEVMQRGWKWNGNPKNDPRNPGDGSGIFDETLREPFPWYKAGSGPGQTTWFDSRFDQPNDGVSKEEQEQPGKMLHLVRGLTRLRARHPALANGTLGEIPSDAQDWMVFEKVGGPDRYLVLINLTGKRNSYQFHAAWYPRYLGAQLIFESDGGKRTWRDLSDAGQRITNSVDVPAFGLVVIRQAAPTP